MDKHEFQLDKIRAILKAVDGSQESLTKDDLLLIDFAILDLLQMEEQTE